MCTSRVCKYKYINPPMMTNEKPFTSPTQHIICHWCLDNLVWSTCDVLTLWWCVALVFLQTVWKQLILHMQKHKIWEWTLLVPYWWALKMHTDTQSWSCFCFPPLNWVTWCKLLKAEGSNTHSLWERKRGRGRRAVTEREGHRIDPHFKNPNPQWWRRTDARTRQFIHVNIEKEHYKYT